MLMYIDHFSPKKAVPISNFLILLSSISGFYLGAKNKENHPNIKFVDYDMIIIAIPSLAIGTKIGELLYIIVPWIIIDIVLIIYIIYSIIRFYSK
jgi:uncharacterized membrane protein YfcA